MSSTDPAIRPKASEITGAPMRGDTLGAAIDRYLTTYAAERMEPDYFKHTKYSLERDVKPALGERAIREITHQDVRELIDGIVDHRTPTVAHNTLAYLRLMLNWAVKNDLIEANPAKGLTIPATPGRKAAYTWHNELKRKRLAEEELEKATLLLAPGTRCVPYYQVYSETPSRPGKGYELATQQRTVKRLIENARGTDLIHPGFEQLERPRSYNQTERLQLGAALRYCKAQNATLVIAHLGRMAASPPFISQLHAFDVPFVCCDNSDVTPLTIEEVAIAAQARKAAKIENMRALRASGVLRNRPVETPEGRRRSSETATRKAREFAAEIHPYLEAARRKGGTHKQLAAMLNSVKGLKTRQGLTWNRQTITRALRLARSLPPPTEPQIQAAAKQMQGQAAATSLAASAPAKPEPAVEAVGVQAAPATAAQPPKKKRGVKRVLRDRIITEMLADIREGVDLWNFDEEALAARYRASRGTVREARKEALSA